MKILFKSIYIRNFLSIGETNLNLDDLGYCLIKGINKNKNDNTLSNGSGKSSIIESIAWCLTGQTIRQVKDVENIYTTGGVKVELKLQIDNDEYVITRYKNDTQFGTNLKIYINNEDKSGKGIRDTEKLLSDYLPDITPMFLGSVILLGQGLPQRLTNNTPSGRKEILEQLSKSDFMVEDIKQKLENRQMTLKSELRDIEDTVLKLENSLNIFNSELKSNESKLQELQKEDIEKNKVEVSILNTKITIIANEINSVSNTITQKEQELEKTRDEYTNFIENYNSKENTIKDKYKKDLDTIELTIKSKELEKDSLNREITKLESIKNICPTCGQKLPNIHKVDTTDLHIQLDNIIKNIKTLNEESQIIYNNKDNELNKFYNTENINKENLIKKGKDLKEELNNTKLYLKTKQDEKSNTEKRINEYNIQINTLQSQINDIQNKIIEINKKTNEISKEKLYNINKIDNLKEHLDVNSKMNTLVSRDFRGYLLNNVISYIDNKAKEYSQCISENSEIEFKLDGNNIYIGYNGKQYEALSGGEKQKVDLIIQFSIRDMLVEYTNFHCNILALDEIFDNLDSIGCQKIIDIISNKINDISSIFIITHHTEDLQIPTDKIIEVIKSEDGVSSINEI